jgi:hypothetical protein
MVVRWRGLCPSLNISGSGLPESGAVKSISDDFDNVSDDEDREWYGR